MSHRAPIFAPAPAALPRGERVYAIGDVHGCLDRLRALHGAIAADLAARPAAHTTLVHLGDLIDRGPDSAGVVALLAGPAPVPAVRSVVLKGNHEAMLLQALQGDAQAAAHWLDNGGDRSLASWGIARSAPPGEWATALPAGHLGFLSALPLSHRAGGYVFVHAGLRAGVALAAQSARDMLWMREPFLSHRADYGVVVVHGHTPAEAPEVLPWRIGIDTGAVLGGRLTCAVLEGDRVGFLQV